MQEDKAVDSNDEVENSAWAKTLLPMETNQRKKKQTSLSGNKPNHETVLFIDATVTTRTSPLEGISSAVSTVFTELLQNTKIGLQKAITSALVVPLKWAAAKKYVKCLNNRADPMRPIIGNKPLISSSSSSLLVLTQT